MTREPRSPPDVQPDAGLSYREAGVDIDAGDQLVENIKPIARRTLRDGVLAGIGGFGALFEVPKRYPKSGAGVRHRRRGHQAEAGLSARPARHDRHRSGGDERQRYPGAGRRTFVLSRLLRLRALGRGHRHHRDQGYRSRLRAGRLRADRRRNRGDAGHVSHQGSTTWPALRWAWWRRTASWMAAGSRRATSCWGWLPAARTPTATP